MNIFLSYASEYRAIAEQLAVGLAQDGHQVFFDRDDLPAADGYHGQIRQGIESADLVVFLLSPESIESSSYALTELNLVKERWPDPSNRVLPVMVKRTPYNSIPAYLGAVTILEPQGNVVADVLAEVAKIEKRRKRPRLLAIGAAAIIVAVAAALAAKMFIDDDGPDNAGTAMLITGSVTDSSTGTAIRGAQVEIARGADPLGQAVSGADGRFRVSINVPNTPEAQNLKLTVSHIGHAGAESDVVVVSGRPDRAAYPFELLPSAVTDCVRGSDHVVVVGYFRPPASQAGDTGLADRVKDTLDYDLLAPMQLVGVPTGMQPTILACGNAQPRAATDYAEFAKALGADAFLAGYVTAPASPSNPKVKVEMVIADRHGVLQPPARASSPDVDLDDPAAARLSSAAHVAILTALIAGYEKAGQAAECVEVGNAAERVVGTLPPGLAQARERCAQKLPNRSLLRSSP